MILLDTNIVIELLKSNIEILSEIENDIPLYTLNIKDFKFIKDLKLYN